MCMTEVLAKLTYAPVEASCSRTTPIGGTKFPVQCVEPPLHRHSQVTGPLEGESRYYHPGSFGMIRPSHLAGGGQPACINSGSG